MFKIGKVKSILTGGHFPHNPKYNKPMSEFTGGLFEYIFQSYDINIETLELIFDYFDIEIILNEPEKVKSFLDYSSLPNKDLLRCGDVYNNERKFFQYTQLEANNKFGLPCTYYKVLYDVHSNPIFGENSNMIISEMFKNVMVYCQIPRETKRWSKFGIDYIDNFPMYCSKIHFDHISNSYIPQMGDYIMMDFNSNLYEIVEIKEEQAGYLQSKQYSWNFIVRPFKVKSNVMLANNLKDSPISEYIKVKDIYDITNPVNIKAETVMYKPKIGEKPQNNPWQSTI